MAWVLAAEEVVMVLLGPRSCWAMEMWHAGIFRSLGPGAEKGPDAVLPELGHGKMAVFVETVTEPRARPRRDRY